MPDIRWSTKRLTTQEFIEKAVKRHGTHYDYSEVIYKTTLTRVFIKCRVCGSKFYQTPYKHLKGEGCRKCSFKKSADKQRMTTQNFIDRCNKIHKGQYDYSKVECYRWDKKVEIRCKKHNKIFFMRQGKHLGGQGCPTCRYEKSGPKRRQTHEHFIKKAREIHGEQYDYSKCVYTTNQVKMPILCRTCNNEFLQDAAHHLMGCGCPNCNFSGYERCAENWFQQNGIVFGKQQTFDGLRHKKSLRFDFSVWVDNQIKCLIEIHGIQHYHPVGWFGGQKSFETQQLRDQIKQDYCTNNNIPLHIIKYTEDIESRLKQVLINT